MGDEWRIIPTTNSDQPSPQNDNEPKRKFSPSNYIAKTNHLNSPSLVANVGKVSNKISQENKTNGRIVVGKERKIPISILEDVIIDTAHGRHCNIEYKHIIVVKLIDMIKAQEILSFIKRTFHTL